MNMLENLKRELLKIGVDISVNHSDTHDYEFRHNNCLVGHGCNVNETNETLGFWGYMGPNFNPVLSKQPYSSLVWENFQIYISNNQYWYSPPSNNILGYSCIPLTDITLLKLDLNVFVKGNLIINKWNESYINSNHYNINQINSNNIK